MQNKNILLIGGTGAVGQEIIKFYSSNNNILILSRDEHKQSKLAKNVNENVSFSIGDIKDENSLSNSISDFKPEIIINVAALKHVQICESNPIESIEVNILGNRNLLNAIKKCNHNVKCVIFTSTDKACNPVSVYGMCKSISEKLYIENSKHQNKTKICIVRFGNILNSTGSAIPFFKKLLREGSKSIPITDEKMTRFFISLKKTVEIIDRVYEHPNSNGKIIIPKLKSMTIVNLAKALIKHYTGDENSVKLEIIGTRGGERIQEDLISSEEWMKTEEEQDIYLIGNKIIKNECKSFNTIDHIMSKDDVYDFLKDNDVFN